MKEKKNNLKWFVLIVLLVAGAVAYAQLRDQWLGQGEQSDQVIIQQHNSLQQQKDSLVVNLSRTLNPLVKDVQGELVWSNQQQQGTIRVANLPSLKEDQFYQLWVFDRQGASKAVSAGKLTADQLRKEVYWQLAAKELITEPYKFVLTLEKQDDIVPEKMLLLAQP